MPELSEKQRDRLPDRDFAYVDDDDRKLPVHDESHARNALARFDQTEFDSAEDRRTSAKKVLAAAKRFGIEVDPDDAVARAARD